MNKILIIIATVLLSSCNMMGNLILGTTFQKHDLYYTSEFDVCKEAYVQYVLNRQGPDGEDISYEEGQILYINLVLNVVFQKVEYRWDYTEGTLTRTQSPKETWETGKGDCEDFTLLFMNIVYETSLGMIEPNIILVQGIGHFMAEMNGRQVETQAPYYRSMNEYVTSRMTMWEVFNY